MQTTLPHPTDPSLLRTVTIQPTDNGADTREVDKAFYEAIEQPAGSLRELLEMVSEKLRERG